MATSSGLSFASFITARPWLGQIVKPMASWYYNAAGYRQLGLRADDLYEEESDTMQLALSRLSEKEAYDRIFRIRRAVQCSYQHKLLPKHEWTKPEEDVRYLSPILDAIKAEKDERAMLDTAEIHRK